MMKKIRKSRCVSLAEIPKNEMNEHGYPIGFVRGVRVWLDDGQSEMECNIVKAGWAFAGYIPYEGVKQSTYRWVPVCEGCASPRCVAKAEEEE